jgi:uncharacterized SAM-binding protein YcdF (DUF218 family)
VLVFADDLRLASAAAMATLGLLFVLGFVDGRLRAVLWALVLVASAMIADGLWWVGWAPFDRSHEYEAMAQTPFVVIVLPVLMVVVAAGVAVRAIWRRGVLRAGSRGGDVRARERA